MECARCHCKPIESDKAFFPIDPKGTDNRRWVCADCITKSEYSKIDNTVKNIVNVIENDNK
jgi:predicted P-loop ATPase